MRKLLLASAALLLLSSLAHAEWNITWVEKPKLPVEITNQVWCSEEPWRSRPDIVYRAHDQAGPCEDPGQPAALVLDHLKIKPTVSSMDSTTSAGQPASNWSAA